MKAKIALLAAAFFLTLASHAAPTLTVAAPRKKAALTNALLTATGVAKSKSPLAGIYYSLNGGPWTGIVPVPQTNLVNWSTPPLQLSAGPNQLAVYAVDATRAVSRTNIVTFNYVLLAPVAFQIQPAAAGTLTPNPNGKALQIGGNYRVGAKPAKGFKFYGWYTQGSNAPGGGSIGFLTNSPYLTFKMQSNLTFIASFSDAQRPLCVVTYPAVKHSVSNSPLSATLRAVDNVAVTGVFYRLNGGAWASNAVSADGTNYTLPDLALAAGPNTLQACAVDAAGNLSLTNTVTFTFLNNANGSPTALAPASLSGLVGVVSGVSGNAGPLPPFSVSFGQSTLVAGSAGADQQPSAGNYRYTVLDSNTVRLVTTTLVPPTQSGTGRTHIFVFTNSTTCIGTNDDGTLNSITFSPAANWVASPSSVLTLQYTEDSGGSGTLTLNGGAFTNHFNDPVSGAQTGWGTCVLEPFTSMGEVLQLVYTDPDNAGAVHYLVLRFSALNAGSWSSTALDPYGEKISSGAFQIVSAAAPPPGNAPMGIEGKTFKISAGGHTMTISFGAYTYSMFDGNTNDENTTLGDYTYMKTGADTASIVTTDLIPPQWSDQTIGTPVFLTFTSATSATFTHINSDGQVDTGTGTLSTATAYAPASLEGNSITSSSGGSGTFANGAFTFTRNGESRTWPCDYVRCSPVGALLVLGPRPEDGSVSYVQLQFSGATAGSWFQSDFDSSNTFQGIDAGTFKLQ